MKMTSFMKFLFDELGLNENDGNIVKSMRVNEKKNCPSIYLINFKASMWHPQQQTSKQTKTLENEIATRKCTT